MEDVKVNNIENSEIFEKPPVKQKKELSVKTKRLIFVWSMLAYPILQFLVFFVYVNIDTVILSFKFFNDDKVWVTSLETYRRLFDKLLPGPLQDDYLLRAIKNSLLVGLNDLILTTISVTMAYFFYKKMPGRGVFRIIFFLPSIVSIVVYTMVFQYMFDSSLGDGQGGPAHQLVMAVFKLKEAPYWFEKDLGIWMIMLYCLWVGTGYNILILGGAIANLPEEVMESARLDGAKMRHELFQLVIPMIWPTISVAILGSVTTMFTLFLQVKLITDGKAPTIAWVINGAISSEFTRPQAAAIGIVCTVVATPIILLVKKILDKASESFGF